MDASNITEQLNRLRASLDSTRIPTPSPIPSIRPTQPSSFVEPPVPRAFGSAPVIHQPPAVSAFRQYGKYILFFLVVAVLGAFFIKRRNMVMSPKYVVNTPHAQPVSNPYHASATRSYPQGAVGTQGILSVCARCGAEDRLMAYPPVVTPSGGPSLVGNNGNSRQDQQHVLPGQPNLGAGGANVPARSHHHPPKYLGREENAQPLTQITQHANVPPSDPNFTLF